MLKTSFVRWEAFRCWEMTFAESKFSIIGKFSTSHLCKVCIFYVLLFPDFFCYWDLFRISVAKGFLLKINCAQLQIISVRFWTLISTFQYMLSSEFCNTSFWWVKAFNAKWLLLRASAIEHVYVEANLKFQYNFVFKNQQTSILVQRRKRKLFCVGVLTVWWKTLWKTIYLPWGWR